MPSGRKDQRLTQDPSDTLRNHPHLHNWPGEAGMSLMRQLVVLEQVSPASQHLKHIFCVCLSLLVLLSKFRFPKEASETRTWWFTLEEIAGSTVREEGGNETRIAEGCLCGPLGPSPTGQLWTAQSTPPHSVPGDLSTDSCSPGGLNSGPSGLPCTKV